ncbi:hypothetical protein Hanom_Chr08g00727851 [Helianthus anomalus]
MYIYYVLIFTELIISLSSINQPQTVFSPVPYHRFHSLITYKTLLPLTQLLYDCLAMGRLKHGLGVQPTMEHSCRLSCLAYAIIALVP